MSSHLLTPGLWLRQVGDLSRERRALGLPSDRPKAEAPRHLFEDDAPQRSTAGGSGGGQGLAEGMRRVDLNGGANGQAPTQVQPMAMQGGGGAGQAPANPPPPQQPTGKLTKEQERPREKEKKRHKFGFGKG